MNIHQSLRTSSLLAAALLTIAGAVSSAKAGDWAGGKGEGVVGGTVGGLSSVAGGLTNGVTGAVNGVTGTVSGVAGSLSGASSMTANNFGASTFDHAPYGTFHSPTKVIVVAKLKLELLHAKAGVYVLGKHGELVRVSTKIALEHILRANAKVFVLSKGNLIRVNARVALLGIKGKAKVYVLDGHDLLKAKALIAFGGHEGLTTKVGAKVGTSGAVVQIGLSLGNIHHPGNGNNGSNTGGSNGSTISGTLNSAVAGLSADERGELKRKCPSVLISPASYTRDAVRVCQVLSQLSGL